MNGLDTGYFRKNLECILRDLESYTPAEMETALERLAAVASEQKISPEMTHNVKLRDALKRPT